MELSEIETRLRDALAPQELKVATEGGHYSILIVSDSFDGQSKVRRQQTVYGPLMDKITDGTLHALTIKAFTSAEWQKEKIFHN